MGDVDPLLDDSGSLLSFELSAPQDGADDTLGEGINLRDCVADRGSQMLVFFFIPLRPDAAQAVGRHPFLAQLLRQERE